MKFEFMWWKRRFMVTFNFRCGVLVYGLRFHGHSGSSGPMDMWTNDWWNMWLTLLVGLWLINYSDNVEMGTTKGVMYTWNMKWKCWQICRWKPETTRKDNKVELYINEKLTGVENNTQGMNKYSYILVFYADAAR